MLLESIDASNFRNLDGGMMCEVGLNILVGENGEGKTNWLEAIYLLATARSFRTSKLQESVRFGESLGFVSGMVAESPEITPKLQGSIRAKTKTPTVTDKKETVHPYLGQFPPPVFNP